LPDCAKCALFLFRCVAYGLVLDIISYITRTQAQAEGKPPLGRDPARSAAPPSPKSLQSSEASKSTALKVSCTMARASCGLMYWMGRDNGNEHFLGSPACRGPVQGGTLPHPSGAWEGVRAALCVGGIPSPHAHIPAPVCPIGQRTDTRVGVQKKGARKGARGSEKGKGSEGYLARRMQGVHFLTKCQRWAIMSWHVVCKVYIF